MNGIIYYTNNLLSENIALACRNQLKKIGLPIVSISHYPLNFGNNYVVDLPNGILSMFKQILIALEKSKANVIWFAEHDVIYHLSHFDFTPPMENVYYFNTNVWSLDSESGKTLHYDGMAKTSGLVAYREILLEHYRKKIEKIKKEGWKRQIGYEPGKSIRRGGVDNYKRDYFKSENPNIDIKHGNNLTKMRWELSEYRCQKRLKNSWTIEEGIPFWGHTKGRFNDFLRGLQ